jgi:uncharacterized ubiquitin-like protein YukD
MKKEDMVVCQLCLEQEELGAQNEIAGSSDEFQISVQLLSGKTIELNVEAGNTIKEVKAKISDKEGIPISQQHLVLGDRQLVDDDMMIWNYGISEGEILNLLLVATFTVKVKHDWGRDGSILLTVKPGDSIYSINKILAKKFDYPKKYARLRHFPFDPFDSDEEMDEDADWDEYVLENNKTFADYNITDRAVLGFDCEGDSDPEASSSSEEEGNEEGNELGENNNDDA